MRDTHPRGRIINFILCLGLFTAMLALPASALMVELSPSYLAGQSDAIATGTVISVESRWDEGGTAIETVVSFSVDRTLAGRLPESPVLVVPGGTVDEITQWVEDVPVFLPGENVGLFLRERPDGSYLPVGLSQGVVPLAGQSPAKTRAADLLTPEEFGERVDAALQGDAGIAWTAEATFPAPVGTAEVASATASAGTGTEVMITGSGFGTKAFRESDGDVAFFFTSSGSTLYWIYASGYAQGVSDWQSRNSNDIVSWTDSTIVCKVPTGIAWRGSLYHGSASSGPVYVLCDDGTTTLGPYSLSVPFGWSKNRWQGTAPVVSFYVNPPAVSGALAATQNAAGTWTAVQGSDFSFQYAGTTTATGTGYNGKNEILWADIATDGVLAQASTWSYPGQVIECDIKFNTRYTWSTASQAGAYDIETICLHELGHWVQLKDLYGNIQGFPSDAAKVMYGWAGAGQVKRSLTESDAAGARWIYPGQTPAPAITGITPGSGYTGNVVQITDLAGTGFQTGATVKLTRTGHPDIAATGVSVVSPSRITCTLDLAGRAVGSWDVAVTNPDGQSAVLAQGFTIRNPAPITLAASKDAVMRGNAFNLTLGGEGGGTYFVYLRAAEGTAPAEYPFIAPGQPGISNIGTSGPRKVANATAASQANVTTTLTGTRTIQFMTNASTKPQAYTVEAIDWTDPSRSAAVMVSVEQGTVTVAVPGTGAYYIGEEIILSGTSTDSDTVYLFLTGPNLATNGVRLSDLGVPVMDSTPMTFTRVDVEAGDTWCYRWDTACLNRTPDAGGYTIYAVSTPRDRAHLADAVYATATIQLRPPSITAGVSNATLIPGEEFWIAGNAGGAPPNVNIWIFGPNYYGGYNGGLGVRAASVETDGAFKYTLKGAETCALQKGQYYVVVQHPVDCTFGVMADTANGVMYGKGIANVTLTSLQPYDAAIALITALDSPGVDDIYTRLTFEVIDTTPQAHFTADITNGTAPLTVQFTDRSIGSPATWFWSFGDGATATEQNPVHTYTVPGVYNVGLTVSNSAGSDTETKPGYVIVTAPVQNTLSFAPPSSGIRIAETTVYSVILNTVPTGLAGFNISVALTDPSIGEIVAISYPPWANLPVSSSLPADTVYAQAVDFMSLVEAGAANVTLCTLTVRGDVAGETNLTITTTKIDDDVGGRYTPIVIGATLTVHDVQPFPNPAGGNFPAPTDPDGDGRYEDLDGNGFVGFNDVVVYYQNMEFIESSQPLAAFDYDGSGFVGFNDVVSLYRMV